MKRTCAKCGLCGDWKFVDCRNCYLLERGKLPRPLKKPADFGKYYRHANPGNAARSRKWRAANPERSREIRRAAIKLRRDYVNSLKSGPCTDCGGTFHPEAMDFDHARGEKDEAISRLVNKAADFEVLKAELAKCDLVCANCHRVRTRLRRTALTDSGSLCILPV